MLIGLIAGTIAAAFIGLVGRPPDEFRIIFGSSITTTVIVVFLLNLLFNHLKWRQQDT